MKVKTSELIGPALDWAVPKIAELMSTTWNGVEFTAAHGQPADDWEHASH